VVVVFLVKDARSVIRAVEGMVAIATDGSSSGA
jgi:hypothetical protein